jgi:hypothetical protein
MNNQREPEMVLEGNLGGIRMKIRPRKRWIHNIQEGTDNMGVKRWINAMDRVVEKNVRSTFFKNCSYRVSE